MWIQANLGVRTGWPGDVINESEMHCWHDARTYLDGDRKFGVKVAIWDWIFGTAYRPLAKPGPVTDSTHRYRGYLAQHARRSGASTPVLRRR